MKIVVFDDDPTGSQTVFGCPLVLRLSKDNLRRAIRHKSDLLFLLLNSRSMPSDLADQTIRLTCRRVDVALKESGILPDQVLFVSRGDSTLRGHGFLEPAAINDVLGPFDATLHIPAFFEGGRTTIDGVHFLNGLPVHQTEFALDKTFGYKTSHLALWLEEKSNGKISAEDVIHLSISLLNDALCSSLGMQSLIDRLLSLSDNQSVVVDAKYPEHLAVLVAAIKYLVGKKRFLFRSAASLINALAEIPSNQSSPESLGVLRLRSSSGLVKPGLVIVGSHVPLADAQLKLLLQQSLCIGIELPVHKIAKVFDGEFPKEMLVDWGKEWLTQLNNILKFQKTPVLYTSREEIVFTSLEARVEFCKKLAEFMAVLVGKVKSQLGYVISKGGITTHTLLEKGFNLESVELKGQILPGLSIVCDENNFDSEGLPIVTFPGNLGDKNTLLSAWNLMEKSL